jgi:hypothetical protein
MVEYFIGFDRILEYLRGPGFFLFSPRILWYNKR